MGVEDIALTSGPSLAAAGGSLATADRRRFWLGLACAAALHAALLLGASRSAPRIMGERDGSLDGISVELVDAADLLSRSTVSSPEAGAPGAPRPVVPPPRPPQPPAEAASPAPDVPAPQKAAAAPPTEGPTPAPAPVTLPDLAGEPGAAKAAPKTPPKAAPKPQAHLDLSLPPDLRDAPMAPGRSAGVSRPPGVTRSGENDEFGRGVIRALRQTMPSPRDVAGRVTVRLFLSEKGNLSEVSIIRSAGDPILDQSVVFAVKQASFPIPPVGATLSDRTFLVTYIYR